MSFDYQTVQLKAMTQPTMLTAYALKGDYGEPLLVERPMTADEFIAYTARVSNPSNQDNMKTAPKLIKYLIDNEHWSPFEMVSLTLEIKTTRDIGRQILRHRSFSFQEFSQRYAQATEFATREARLQDTKNRQNSIETKDEYIHSWWSQTQSEMQDFVQKAYTFALNNGIAKEQARAILPEGLTLTTMYMTGTLRSWLHYCKLRCSHGTQKEHMDIAIKVRDILIQHFPSCTEYLLDE